MQPVYLMSPTLFEGLRNVSGFTSMNGKTYPEHICIILNDQLTQDQKNSIKSKTTEEDVLAYLKTIINYTHECT